MANQDNEWVLAFDTSKVCSAYCFGSSDRKNMTYGKYVADSSKDLTPGQHLYNFSNWLRRVFRKLPQKPTRVVSEIPYCRRNLKTYAILSKYIAIVEFEIHRVFKKEVEFVSPSMVKTIMGVKKGKTHEERKQIMVNEINSKFGLELSYHPKNKNISDDDIADAIAVFDTFCERLVNGPSKPVRKQRARKGVSR